MKIASENPILGYQLAEQLGYTEFADLQRVYNRARSNDANADNLPTLGKNEPVQPEVEAFVRQRFGKNGKMPQMVNPPPPPPPKLAKEASKPKPVKDELEVESLNRLEQVVLNQNTAPSVFSWDWLPTRLDLLNYIEMGFASFGLWVMLKESGLFVAALSCIFYYDAQQSMKEKTAWMSSDFALFMALVIGCGFGFVHFNTLKVTIQTNNYDQWWTCFMVALAVSGMSFAALIQTRNKTKDRQDG